MRDRVRIERVRVPLKQWPRYMFIGLLIGGGAILPGVSGGVLCVVFGLYRPMMAFFAHPFRTMRALIALFVPVAIGWALGFIVFAKLINAVLVKYEIYTICLFIGLIAGTVPAMLRDAKKFGRTRGSWVAMAVGFAVVFAALSVINLGWQWEVQAGTGWFFFCGVLWGLSIIVPGMTSTSILMSLGLFQPLTEGLGSLDLAVVTPWAVGIVCVILALARLVNSLFELHYPVVSHCVTGIVLASTLAIVPLSYGSVGTALICAALAAAGFAAALFIDRIDPNEKKQNDENN